MPISLVVTTCNRTDALRGVLDGHGCRPRTNRQGRCTTRSDDQYRLASPSGRVLKRLWVQ
jgi:hypothetical protein